jgi:predicted GNAT superfamily acetyltransferase
MGIEYRELTASDDIEQCLDLQRQVFGFTETELISPLFFKLISRGNPPVGIAIGVFDNRDGRQNLIGLMIGFASFLEKSVYTVLLGIQPAYQAGIYGYKLLLKFREIASSRGIETMYGVFEPLEANLARLYVGGVGFIPTEYFVDVSDAQVPSDKFLFRWDFDSPHTQKKLGHSTKPAFAEVFDSTLLALTNNFPDEPRIFVEIPGDWLQTKTADPESARFWRLQTRAILAEYVNHRHYTVIDCLSGKVAGERKTYYVLEKSTLGDYT